MENILLSNAFVDGKQQSFLINVATDETAVYATALVGIGSVLVSLALVWVTWKNQKSLNSLQYLNTKLAHLDKLQDIGAKFLSFSVHVGNLIRQGEAISSPVVLQNHSEMLFYQSSLVLMLPTSDENKTLVSLLGDIANKVTDKQTSVESMSKLISQAGTELNNFIKKERAALLESKT
ncbi:hypothetical protein LQN34_003540 [Vibrio cholerae]|uniref:hypothetical protein n=1 Tax=Vibrio cholerae TaxID=666 RepID=UPI0011DC20C2|nr:hypothetical protein [Vibrio cholerae]EIO5090086.1 hypothetical protein [Vibrio cholerae]EKF9078880.1 hypothetical protein [Vibrio cholerae]MDV2372980.1 hypothetical protein [Vibrio cholerae]TXX76461.1 hypothetical protein FXE96_08560 [Vibrio cholerae]GIA35163.1 hypothetical protein VCSRO130_3490 [Vibrio cholerae]